MADYYQSLSDDYAVLAIESGQGVFPGAEICEGIIRNEEAIRALYATQPDQANFDAMRRGLLKPEPPDDRSGLAIQPELYR